MELSPRAASRALSGAGRRALLGGVIGGLFTLTSCATYSASRPVVPQPVTVGQIVKMSKEGLAPEGIISRMRAPRTVYRLSASQLGQIRDQGVSDTVIDYMQHTYLAAVRRSARFEGWRYWHHWGDDFWYSGEAFGWPHYWYWPDDDFLFPGPVGNEGHGNEGHEGHGGRH